MIVTVEGLAIVREQLALIEDDLVALRRELLPHDPDSFELLSEAHVAMIRSLRAEIDLFLGLPAVGSNSLSVTSDLVMVP